jgi:diphthamide biosynthesis methyltransferase
MGIVKLFLANSATTHTDLILRAKKEGIRVEVIHNTSVMGAAASCGLQVFYISKHHLRILIILQMGQAIPIRIYGVYSTL